MERFSDFFLCVFGELVEPNNMIICVVNPSSQVTMLDHAFYLYVVTHVGSHRRKHLGRFGFLILLFGPFFDTI